MSRQYLVEIQDPGGQVLMRTFARAGQVVKFRGLKPGIYSACVKDISGACRCLSIDLYPDPAVRAARFSIDLKTAASAPQADRLNLVDKTSLAVPEAARQEFGECLKDRRSGHPAEAIGHLERAVEIHPEYPEALTNLGVACHLAGDYARAMQLFTRVTQVAPEMYAGWLNLGVVLLLTGETGRALQAELRALSLRPDDPFVIYQVGLCYFRLNEFAEAKKHLRRVIELDAVSATYPHVCLARIALAENQLNEAESLIRRVFELHPYSPWPPGLKEVVDRLAISKGSSAKTSRYDNRR